MAARALILLALWAILGSVHGQGKVPYDWRNAPYDNDDFNIKVHYTHDAVLECNDTRVSEHEVATIERWITPELEILLPGEELEFETLDGVSGWYVSEDGFNMYINLTHDRHFGMYYCMVQTANGTEMVVKTSINFKGAYWGNTWWRYETATIWSLVGSAICAAFFAIGAFVWTRFEDNTEQVDPDEDDFDAILAKLGYNNDAFNDDGYNGLSEKPPQTDMQIRESPHHQTAPPPVEDITSANSGYEVPFPANDGSGYEVPFPANDDVPDPYDTVVEINGTAKVTTTSPPESVAMQELKKESTNKPDAQAIEITDDIKF